jgi:hypothetical protein
MTIIGAFARNKKLALRGIEWVKLVCMGRAPARAREPKRTRKYIDFG